MWPFKRYKPKEFCPPGYVRISKATLRAWKFKALMAARNGHVCEATQVCQALYDKTDHLIKEIEKREP